MLANLFLSSTNYNCSPLALIHSDLHGPLPVATYQDYKYWITFIDDFTCFKAVYLLKTKSHTFNVFKKYKA